MVSGKQKALLRANKFSRMLVSAVKADQATSTRQVRLLICVLQLVLLTSSLTRTLAAWHQRACKDGDFVNTMGKCPAGESYKSALTKNSCTSTPCDTSNEDDLNARCSVNTVKSAAKQQQWMAGARTASEWLYCDSTVAENNFVRMEHGLLIMMCHDVP